MTRTVSWWSMHLLFPTIPQLQLVRRGWWVPTIILAVCEYFVKLFRFMTAIVIKPVCWYTSIYGWLASTALPLFKCFPPRTILISGHFYVSRDRVGSVCSHIKERKAKRSKKGKKERKKKKSSHVYFKGQWHSMRSYGRSTDVGVGWGRGVYIGVDEEGSTIL